MVKIGVDFACPVVYNDYIKSGDNMELQEFTHQLRQELRGFDKYWRESTRESPEDFPNRLGFEEWLDQFNTWAGSNG